MAFEYPVDAGPPKVATTTAIAAEINDELTQAKARANHTGTQAISTVTGLQAALDAKAPIANPTFTGTVGGVTKAMVGLGDVDNTTDAAKPISTATQTALDAKAPIANPTFTGTVGGVTKAMVGLGNADNTSDANKPISTATQTALDGKAAASHTHVLGNVTGLEDALAAKAPLASPTFTGVVAGITKEMVGLGNIDNTSDANKPISTATQTALNAKAPIASPTFTGTVSGVTKAMVGLGNVDNTADSAKPISTATQTALDAKAPIANPTFTGTVSGVTKAMVGLGDVDNTTDAAKPISTATQTALNAKAPIASPTFTGTVSGVTKAMVGLGNADNTADADKPVSTAQAAAIGLAGAPESWRPGDSRVLFTTALTGEPSARAAITAGTEVNSAVLGRALRIDGDDVPGDPGFLDVAARRAFALEPARVYRLRVALARAVDPADPEGNGVEIRLQNLNQNKAAVSNVRLGDVLSPVVADGRVVLDFSISRDVAGVDYTVPSTARYATPHVRIYGNGQETDLEVISWADVTDAVGLTSDLTDALAAKANINSPTFTGTVSGITSAMVGLGNVDNVSAADLRARGTHTGTQAISTVDGLQAALDGEASARAAGDAALQTGIDRLDPVQTIATDAPAWSAGDGETTFITATPDDLRHPVVDDLRTRTAPISIDPDLPEFSTGNGVRGTTIARADIVRNAWLDAVATSARQGIQVPRLYLDGDSRSDLCSAPGRTLAQGWAAWLQMLARGRFDWREEWNFGVGGQNSDALRFRTGLLATLPPGVVAVICSTNERTGGETAAWTIARLAEYQARVLHYGHRILWIAETPRGDSVETARTLSATQMAHMMRVRQWLLDQANTPGVYVVDPWPVMADPARTDGRALDTILRDGIHWGAFGGATLARAMLPVIEALFPPRDRLPAVNADVFGANNPGGSLTPNPMMDGTGGAAGTGCSGDVATGWTATAADGLAAVCSKQTFGGKAWQRLVVSGGATGSASGVEDDAGGPDPTAVSVQLAAPITPANLSAGDVIEGVAEILIAAGSSGLRGVTLTLEVETAGGTILTHAMVGDTIRSQPNLDYPPDEAAGVLVTPPYTIPAAVVSARAYLSVTGANFSGDAATIAATVNVRAVKIRKVI